MRGKALKEARNILPNHLPKIFTRARTEYVKNEDKLGNCTFSVIQMSL